MAKLRSEQTINPNEIYGDSKTISNTLYWFAGLIFLGLMAGSIIQITAGDIKPAIFTALGEIPVLVSLFLVRNKKFEAVSTFLALFLILLITITATNDLGVHHISVIGYPVVLIIASLVVRKQIMNLLTGFAIICVGWLVFGEIYGLYTPADLVQSVPGDFFTISIIIIITSLIIRRVTEAWFESSRQMRRELANRKTMEEKFRMQADRAEIMASLSSLFTHASQDYQLILDTTVRRCAELIGDGASILLYDPESDFLQLAAVYNPDPSATETFTKELSARPVRVNEGMYAKVIKDKKAVLVESIPIEKLIEQSTPERREYYQKLPLYSMMLAPLHTQDKVLGVIGLGRHTPGRNYTPEDLTYLQDIAERASLAILSAQTHKELQQELAERKRAEDALAFSEEKFSKAFDVVPVLMSIEDTDHTFIDVNREFSETLGFKREDVLGQMASDIKIYASPEDGESLRRELIEKGGLKDFELRYKKKSGEIGFVLMSTENFEINNNSYSITSALDITERKQAEAERENLIAELEAKNAELERFTYTVSHDLKSPLVTINGFLGYLEKEAAAGNIEQFRKDIRRIYGAVNKMQSLLNELLELSRIGRLTNEPETLSFEEIVNDAIKTVEGQIVKRNVEVKIQTGLPKIHGDRQRLTEVLQNLIDNSTKFMGDQQNPLVEIGQQGREDGMTIFFVRDNGIGIAPEFSEKIFGLFNKLDPEIEGTGVGLALVKRIVEYHGGRIWVESEKGNGSTFFFTLPNG
ncbi:MAG: PAS domain S-box protein [Anaerolineales bacterium]|nr:PAS domain S-box protein [Anaerolineales bacterium]